MIGIYHSDSFNFGDRIAFDIVRYLSGVSPSIVTTSPRYITVGSILAAARDGDIIWGTGAMYNKPVWRVPPKIQVCAVRGPLTRRLLLNAGIDCPAVYGDPGIFVPEVYGVKRKPECALGIIPHYIDEHKIPALRAAYPDARIISVKIKAHAFVSAVAACDVIVSSSLHGIITAEALGIPSCWVLLSDRVAGSGFKFQDYYLGSGRGVTPAVDWRFTIKAPVQCAPPPVYMHDKLLTACPFRPAYNPVVPDGVWYTLV